MIDDQVSDIRKSAITGLINFADTLHGLDETLES